MIESIQHHLTQKQAQEDSKRFKPGLTKEIYLIAPEVRNTAAKRRLEEK